MSRTVLRLTAIGLPLIALVAMQPTPASAQGDRLWVPRLAWLDDDDAEPTTADAAEEDEDEGVDEAPSASTAKDAAATALAGEGLETAAQTPPFEAPGIQPTLLDFVTAEPVALKKKIAQTDPLLRPPFRDQPVDSVKGLAAKIRAEELDSCNRIEAVRYLGTLDCVTFPEAKEQLLEVLLNDKYELVRYEAALAITDMLCTTEDEREDAHDLYCNPNYGKRGGDKCRKCKPKHPCLTACLSKIPLIKKHLKDGGKDGRFETGYGACRCAHCCDEDTLNALARVGYEKQDNGCYVEPSARVRMQARRAIQCCGIRCYPAPYYPYYEIETPVLAEPTMPAELPEPIDDDETEDEDEPDEPILPDTTEEADEPEMPEDEPGEQLPKNDDDGEQLPGPSLDDAEDAEEAEEAAEELPSVRRVVPNLNIPTVQLPAPGQSAPVRHSATAAAAATAVTAPAAVPAPAGSIAAALRGYCVVEMTRRNFVPARPDLSTRHSDGETYYFSSAAAKQAFDADPDRYAVRFVGHDPVCYADGGSIVKGTYLRRHHDHFYMFSSKENWERFRRSPGHYLSEIVRVVYTDEDAVR